jgi:hypothetical protein
MNTFLYFALLLLFLWVFTLELRHNGLKGLATDSKALADKAVKDAKVALAAVGAKTKR